MIAVRDVLLEFGEGFGEGGREGERGLVVIASSHEGKKSVARILGNGSVGRTEGGEGEEEEREYSGEGSVEEFCFESLELSGGGGVSGFEVSDYCKKKGSGEEKGEAIGDEEEEVLGIGKERRERGERGEKGEEAFGGREEVEEEGNSKESGYGWRVWIRSFSRIPSM